MSSPLDEAGREARAERLGAALSAVGVEWRPDSNLCKCYVQGTLDPGFEAEAVAQICALHKFLYSYTSYEADCRAVLPSLAAALAPSLGGWACAWHYVKEREAPVIKAAAIRAVGGIPEVWPWLAPSPPPGEPLGDPFGESPGETLEAVEGRASAHLTERS